MRVAAFPMCPSGRRSREQALHDITPNRPNIHQSTFMYSITPNIHSYVFFTNIITLLQCYNFRLYVVMVSRTLVKHLTISCFAFFLYLPQNTYTLRALYTELLRLISIIILSNNVHYQYPFPHFERQFQILSSLEVDPY